MDKEKDIKDSDKRQLSLKNDSLYSFFNNNSLSFYIFKKTQKFVSALYMLTELFEKDNPFRLKVRQAGTNLLSDSLFLALNPISSVTGGNAFRTRSLETLALLESAYYAGFVSEMNLKIFQNEHLGTLNLLEDGFKNGTLSAPVVREDFFKDETAAGSPESSKGHIRHDKGQSVPYNISSVSNHHQSFSKKDTSDDSVRLKNDLDLPRIKTLLSLVKRRPEVSVKDVAAIVVDVSEKTIQRDLLALVSKGVLKKTGERRWSRYSLA